MMVMTAKVDMKRILIILGAIAALIIGCIWAFGGEEADAPTATAPSAADNDSRVAFLKELGWEVSASPTDSGQVKIPDSPSDAFSRYNELQKSQGYDLSRYGGKTVMRYVYKVNNYPNATEPVYATLLVYKNKVIGGDITDTAARGIVQGFKRVETTVPTTLPTESTAAPTT